MFNFKNKKYLILLRLLSPKRNRHHQFRHPHTNVTHYKDSIENSQVIQAFLNSAWTATFSLQSAHLVEIYVSLCKFI